MARGHLHHLGDFSCRIFNLAQALDLIDLDLIEHRVWTEIVIPARNLATVFFGHTHLMMRWVISCRFGGSYFVAQQFPLSNWGILIAQPWLIEIK